MINKHFFKTLFGFMALILLGLGVMFAVNYFDNQNVDNQASPTEIDE